MNVRADLRRTLCEADQIADSAFSDETFPPHARYRLAGHATTGMTFMSQRLKVQEMVMQMHEKSLVLTNMLRDIVENETMCDVSSVQSDEDLSRMLVNQVARRNEIVAEIMDFLRREDLARRVHA
jgi:hypothetical protein